MSKREKAIVALLMIAAAGGALFVVNVLTNVGYGLY
jgi:hypothetical protein